MFWVTAVSFGANSLAGRRGSRASHLLSRCQTRRTADALCEVILMDITANVMQSLYWQCNEEKEQLLLNVSLPIWSCWAHRGKSPTPPLDVAVLRWRSNVPERVAYGPYIHQRSRAAFLRLWSGDEDPPYSPWSSSKTCCRHRHWFAAAGICAACY